MSASTDLNEARRQRILARAGMFDKTANPAAPSTNSLEKLKRIKQLEQKEVSSTQHRLDVVRYIFSLFLGVLTAVVYRQGESQVKNQLTYAGCLLAAFHIVMRVYSTRMQQEKDEPRNKGWIDLVEWIVEIHVNPTQKLISRLIQNLVAFVLAFFLVRSLFM